MTRTLSRLTAAVVVLCALGFVTSVDLTYEHYKAHTDPSHRSICTFSTKVDCGAVALSDEATVLGVPNALWGAFTYLLLGWLAVRARRQGRGTDRGARGFPASPLTWVFWFVLGMAGYTAWLVYVSFARLPSFCVFCAILWVVNAGLLVAMSLGAREAHPLSGFGRELEASRRRPLSALPWVLVPAAIALLAVVFVPRLYPTGAETQLQSEKSLDLSRIRADAAYRGPDSAPHVLVSFSDYRCPYCREAHDLVERARRMAPDRVRVVHLHFPLEGACNPLISGSMHPGACEAALAAECAGRQGRFWEMHDRLFELEGPWREGAADALATALGLDVAAFRACVRGDRRAKDAVAEDVALGERVQLEGTPTLYLDGSLFLVTPTLPALIELLER